jgi:hypothetical protein
MSELVRCFQSHQFLQRHGDAGLDLGV